jgi:hypothetical protein
MKYPAKGIDKLLALDSKSDKSADTQQDAADQGEGESSGAKGMLASAFPQWSEEQVDAVVEAIKAGGE